MIGALAALLLSAPALPQGNALPEQTQVFYNARLALRDHKPADVLRLWLLRNSMEQRGVASPLDAEFRSVVWAAMGDLGLCPDGFPHDDRGAQLWAVALHNQVIVSAARGERQDPPAPFAAFEVGRQQRFISLQDVLDDSELRAATFFPTACNQPDATLGARPAARGEMSERLRFGSVLRSLLGLALHAIERDKVTSVAAIETRLFDLNLELARLQTVQARLTAITAAQNAAAKGASPAAARDVRARAQEWTPSSQEEAFLRRALEWQVDEWLTLSQERRLALFARARKFAKSAESRDALALQLIDALIERKAGAEVEAWISLFEAEPARRTMLVDGERGKRLLELDPSTGFRERGPIALARGMLLLERGERREALRSFAAALQSSGDSREQAATASLGRRWLSYVLGSFETNDEILATLKALVPPLEYNAVIEDLVWKAALRADAASFERLAESARRGGAFDGRVALLRPLSQGNAGALADELFHDATQEPHAALRFVNQLLEHVEGEELDVRRALTPLLRALGKALDALDAEPLLSKTQQRRASELAERNQAILTGLGLLEDSNASRARALSPGQAAFAGNVRLAPADPAPWPFPLLDPVTPSPFRPLLLEPLEWRDAGGALVYGWRIRD